MGALRHVISRAMTGMVFHPGHHELHGITVVVETRDGVTYVGRYDRPDERGVHLLNLAVHDPGSTSTALSDFLVRSNTFGVRAERKHLVVPHETIVRVRTLSEAVA